MDIATTTVQKKSWQFCPPTTNRQWLINSNFSTTICVANFCVHLDSLLNCYSVMRVNSWIHHRQTRNCCRIEEKKTRQYTTVQKWNLVLDFARQIHPLEAQVQGVAAMAQQDKCPEDEALKSHRTIVHFLLIWKNIPISTIFLQHSRITIQGKSDLIFHI